MNINPPLMDITTITFRNQPMVPLFVPGAIPNVVSIGNEAQLLRTLRAFAGSSFWMLHSRTGRAATMPLSKCGKHIRITRATS